MKKAVITAILLIILGAVLSVSALIYLDFDFTKLQTVEIEKRSYNIDSAFDDIAIQTTEVDLVIHPSPDGECRLDCNVRKGTEFTIETINGVLNIKEISPSQSKWYDNIGISWDNCSAVLYLPNSLYESILIETVSGDISLARDFSFKSINAKSTSGDIEVIAENSGQMDIKTTSGDVFIGKRECADTMVKTVSGDIEVSGVISNGTLALKSTSGDIEINNCDGENIEISTASGDVEGSFLTEKSFSVNTTSGDIEVPRRSTGKPCSINTVSGDVEIE